MRLDKFLKVSRLIKRRTVANEVSDIWEEFWLITIPQNPQNSSKKAILSLLNMPVEKLLQKVLKVPTGNVSIQESSTLYELLTD